MGQLVDKPPPLGIALQPSHQVGWDPGWAASVEVPVVRTAVSRLGRPPGQVRMMRGKSMPGGPGPKGFQEDRPHSVLPLGRDKVGTGPAPDPEPPPSATTWNRESTVLEAGALGSGPAHSFIPQVSPEHVLCAWHYAEHWRCSRAQNRQGPCPMELAYLWGRLLINTPINK